MRKVLQVPRQHAGSATCEDSAVDITALLLRRVVHVYGEVSSFTQSWQFIDFFVLTYGVPEPFCSNFTCTHPAECSYLLFIDAYPNSFSAHFHAEENSIRRNYMTPLNDVPLFKK